MKNQRYRLAKSRYSSVDCYISPDSAMYNDIEVVQDPDAFRKLTENGKLNVVFISLQFSCYSHQVLIIY